MKETKEQLIAKIAELETKYQERVDFLERVRKEFAKAFRWGNPKKKGLYDPEPQSLQEWDWQTPTWEQIFVEIGKLKSMMDYRDFDGNLSELEYRLNNLESDIRSDIHPNLPPTN